MQYLYSIFDRVSGLYGSPWTCVSQSVAVRQFDYVVKTRPVDGADLELYQLGSFDPESGALSVFEKPVFVKKAEVADG